MFMNRALFLRGVGLVVLVATAFFIYYVMLLDRQVNQKLDGKRWPLPAVVYARPLELYPGMAFTAAMLERELQLGGYRHESPVAAAGGYHRQGTVIQLISRDFHFPAGLEPSAHLTFTFANGKIASITDSLLQTPRPFVRLDPIRIGSFHPREHEDRILLTRDELPELLVKGLLAVEDKKFYSHWGINPVAIGRAFVVNMKAGRTIQGGSTLTQQLVKNYFLNRDRTYLRKINEAIMSLLLEVHYSKDEILTAYCNEVFFGQQGRRAIHGFALASEFYFRRNIKDLSLEQIALLVGMLKGPSYYDPRRYPERTISRAKAVLKMMYDQQVIDQQQFDDARARVSFKTEKGGSGFNRFPAFLELVRRQLRQDYRQEDLNREGLKILTTLDPQIQLQLEKELATTIALVEKKNQQGTMEGAAIITSRQGGEVLAVAGGKKPLHSGFNRALDARRPIGSLIKPVVYLTALTQGYTLASPLRDVQVTVQDENGVPWRPKNIDKKEHGRVALYRALARSYNLATVNLGLEVGLENVMQVGRTLGLAEDFPAYPSYLLGAVAMSPLGVTQLYQTLATGGFYMPLRSINSVLAADNKVLTRYALSVEQRISPQSAFLINSALQRVVSEGSGRGLRRYVARSHHVAGKTGTSDNMRDSWFAGFTEEYLSVVWLGRDDNKSIMLTGSRGALVAWGRVMRALHSQPLALVEPPGIEWRWIDPGTLKRSNRFHKQATQLPFMMDVEQRLPASVNAGTRSKKQSSEKQSGWRFPDWLRW